MSLPALSGVARALGAVAVLTALAHLTEVLRAAWSSGGRHAADAPHAPHAPPPHLHVDLAPPTLLTLVGLWAAMVAWARVWAYMDASAAYGSWEGYDEEVARPGFGGGAVLVTGAGTGFARTACLVLARRGWVVFAGVLSEEEGQSLAKDAAGEGDVRPVILDVTSDAAVAHAKDFVRASMHGDSPIRLFTVIHNANLQTAVGPLECCEVGEVVQDMSVGCLGALRVTKAFLPLLRETGAGHAEFRPRIVLVSSAVTAFATPFHGAYAMNKFALEALADTLRRELRDVAVTCIQPAMVHTHTAARWPDTLAARWAPEADARYRGLRDPVVRSHRAMVASGLTEKMAARALVHAATCAQTPPARYRVGAPAVASAFLACLPTPLTDAIAAIMMRLS